MAQIFRPYANVLARVALGGVVLLAGGAATWGYLSARSDFWTRTRQPLTQPVPFSHEHHVAGLGIDCRYCHTSVETSAFAGLPPTETCMTCHSQVWKDAPVLQPVRDSFQTGQPLRWTRVYDLPDFVFFNHSAHVAKGVGCASCHGRVDQMPLTFKTQELYMQWCLDCHRAPEKQLRPVSKVFDMTYVPSDKSSGSELLKLNQLHTTNLTECSTCHR